MASTNIDSATAIIKRGSGRYEHLLSTFPSTLSVTTAAFYGSHVQVQFEPQPIIQNILLLISFPLLLIETLTPATNTMLGKRRSKRWINEGSSVNHKDPDEWPAFHFHEGRAKANSDASPRPRTACVENATRQWNLTWPWQVRYHVTRTCYGCLWKLGDFATRVLAMQTAPTLAL